MNEESKRQRHVEVWSHAIIASGGGGGDVSHWDPMCTSVRNTPCRRFNFWWADSRSLKWCLSWMPSSSVSEYQITSWRRRKRKKNPSLRRVGSVFFVVDLRNIKHPERDFVCGLWAWTGEMAGTGEREDRSLAETPSWAFASVISVMVLFGFFFHFSLKHFKKVKTDVLSQSLNL